MRLTKSELNRLIENYLSEQSAKQSSSDVVGDNQFEYKRSPSSKYGWVLEEKMRRE